MNRNQTFAFAGDAALMTAAFALAHVFRTLFGAVHWTFSQSAGSLLVVLAVQFLTTELTGCRRIPWRYITAQDTIRFGVALGLSATFISGARYLLPANAYLPLSYAIIALNTIFAFGFLVGARLLVRLADEGVLYFKKSKPVTRRVLLAGAAGVDNPVLRELRKQQNVELQAVGLLDDDPKNRHAIIHGVPVLGKIADLAKWVRRMRADEVLVTSGIISKSEIRRIADLCGEINIPVRIIPGVSEWLDGSAKIQRIRDVDIADLLGRSETDLNDEAVTGFFCGKTVWVTGGGGSIGAELVRQIARTVPEQLVIIDRSEFALYEIDRELRGLYPNLKISPVLCDVGDAARIQKLFADFQPSVILHAAACKHVPMVELNPGEAVRNNILATRMLAEAAADAGVETFLLVSTDKAVNPVSVMGATKRLAELCVRDLQGRGRTKFCAVRFGNVLGSSGSVIPLFKEQIAAGGPVTVTHPEMRRYFMTIREASRLVLHTATLAEGGEIFVLDMGEPVKITEMAEQMIRLSGLQPHKDIEIVYTGIRPGEKLFEELGIGNARQTRHPQIYIGEIPQCPSTETVALLNTCSELICETESERVLQTLRRWL